VGVELVCFKQPLKKALHTAAMLGADAVEIDGRTMLRPADLSDTALRQIRKMLADLNLRVCAVGFPTRRGYHVAEDLDRRIEATKAAMQMAWKLGAPVVVNQIGQIPDDPSSPQYTTMLEALTELGRKGQHTGAMLAARTGAEQGADLLRMIEALPAGSLMVDFDPGGLLVNGFSASEAIAELAPHVAHVHARDGTRDLARGRGIETPLGRGSIDFPAMLASLEEHNYQGYFTVERNSEQAIEEMSLAIRYLRNIV
jgi:sugar phosphate isomerase/epimerase